MLEKNHELIQRTIREICERCGRDPREIRIVAITKTHPAETIREAYKAGFQDIGENKVQELVSKMDQIAEDITWHMVGAIQTNKIKNLVHRVDWIHSISKTKYLKELEKRAARVERKIRVLIQVNISNEEQKSGCDPGEVADILSCAAEMKHISVHGFMGMASLTPDRELIREQFRTLRHIRDDHRSFEADNIRLDELSMGMSGDYDIAIEEGATMIRLGSSLFGARSYD